MYNLVVLNHDTIHPCMSNKSLWVRLDWSNKYTRSDIHWTFPSFMHNTENLTTSPCSSCIVLMVHVHNMVYKPHRCRHLNHRDGVWDRLLTSTVTSFDASIIEDELDSVVQLQNVRSIVVWCVLYIAQGYIALFVNWITSAKRTREVRPAVESTFQRK